MIELDKNKKYLLACSYGTDSMALFDMLLKGGYNFSVAHVNYNLREASKIETSSLKQYCDLRSVPIYILDFDKFLIKGNVEQDCRYIRYQFFKEIYDEHNFDALLVAHQQDDHIETYILQKERNNIVSCYGLPKERELFGMNVIRPMLHISKKEINEYLKVNNVPFSLDCTNLLDCYERNKVRHAVVEKLTEKERQNILQEIEEKNENNTEKLAKLRDLDLNSISVLLSLDDVEFQLAFYILIENIPYSGGISKSFIFSIRDSLKSDKPNSQFLINSSIVIYKEYDKVVIKKHIPSFIEEGFSYTMNEPGILDTPYFYINTLMDVTNRNITPDDYPLTIRNGNPHDEFCIKDYKVKMRRAIIDWKMPSRLRNRWPVIVNKHGQIIYIPRYQRLFEITDDLNFYVKID